MQTTFYLVNDHRRNKVFTPELISKVYDARPAIKSIRVTEFWKHAWTGGDVPPAKYAGEVFKQVRSILFRELLTICGGLDLWECAGTSRWERARIFWRQANLDAWRTCERAGLE